VTQRIEGDTPDGAAVVDVSNVCWSPELPPRRPGPPGPNVDRLLRLVEAWRREHGAGAAMRFVADASLRHYLPRPEQSRWSTLVRDLGIEVAPVADEVILRHASGASMVILTRDHYIDHRRVHPWIEQRPERFQRWQVSGGRVTFAPLGIVPVPRQVVSRHIEAKELKHAGLDPKRHSAVLRTRWRCTTADCLHARLWQESLLLWPLVDTAGRACCPGCHFRLTSLGPRATTKQIVVSSMADGAELLRFPLEHGAPLVVGRGRLDHGISLDAVPGAPPRIGRLSRQHALLSLDERGALEVVDLGSTNGTTVHRRGATAEPARLPPHVPVRVNGTDHVGLAGVVRFELSGQRFLADTRPPAVASDDERGTEISDVE
jgi:hypothetical protein